MAQNLVIVPGTTWEFYVPGLPSQANTKIDQVNPTLASGDVKFSYAGGTLTTTATTATVAPAGSTQVKITITGAESTGWLVGKQVNVRLSDVSGAEWCDVSVIAVVGEDIDLSDLATATAVADVPTVAEFEARTVAAASYATAAALATVDGIADSILEDTGTTLPAAIAGITAPSAATIADAVWDEATAGHAAAGSTGAALSAAGGAGDPWSVELPAAYTGDQAGALFTDLWANMVGEGEADDPTNPTTVTYKNPAGDVQVTHTLTATTRTPS